MALSEESDKQHVLLDRLNDSIVICGVLCSLKTDDTVTRLGWLNRKFSYSGTSDR